MLILLAYLASIQNNIKFFCICQFPTNIIYIICRGSVHMGGRIISIETIIPNIFPLIIPFLTNIILDLGKFNITSTLSGMNHTNSEFTLLVIRKICIAFISYIIVLISAEIFDAFLIPISMPFDIGNINDRPGSIIHCILNISCTPGIYPNKKINIIRCKIARKSIFYQVSIIVLIKIDIDYKRITFSILYHYLICSAPNHYRQLIRIIECRVALQVPSTTIILQKNKVI